MRKVAKGTLLLWAFAVVTAGGARASDADIASFNTLQTEAPRTIEKVEVLNPSFAYRHIVIQRYGGLYEPRISFTVVNKSAVTISKVYLTGVLKVKGRVAPLAAQDFSFSIPGGLQPGERKHFDLEATAYGDWSSVTNPESRSADFLVKLNAIDDARGERMVR